MQKWERQKILRQIISENDITRQEDLTEMLGKHGFNVTQASISRDLEDLGIIKTGGIYKLPITGLSLTDLGQIKIDPAGENLIIVRCSPGFASAAAAKIDSANIEGIIGTIAGDDTIFVAVSDFQSQKRITREIVEIFNAKAEKF